MAKNKPPTHRRAIAKRQHKQVQPEISKKISGMARSGWVWLCAIFLALMTALGWFGDFLPFWSRVTVASANVLDPNKPLSTMFQLSNDGLFEIYDVQCACGFDSLKSKPIEITNIGMSHENDNAPVVLPGRKHTFQCQMNFLTASEMQNDNLVDITITYRPRFYPFTKKANQKFATKRDANNQLQWVPRA